MSGRGKFQGYYAPETRDDVQNDYFFFATASFGLTTIIPSIQNSHFRKINPVYPDVTADSHILVEATSFRKFDPAKDYLWPLPITKLP